MIKQDAKKIMAGHFGDIFRLHYPIILLVLLSGSFIYFTKDASTVNKLWTNTMNNWWSILISGISAVVTYVTIFAVSDLYFNPDKTYGKNITSYFTTNRILKGLSLLIVTSVIYLVGTMLLSILGALMFLLAFGAPILFFAFVILMVLAIIYVSISFEIAPYVLADWEQGLLLERRPSNYEQLGDFNRAWYAVTEAWKLSKGNRLAFIGFNLSFIGWMFLIAFTLGIAAIWAVPYINIATYGFYRNRIAQL